MIFDPRNILVIDFGQLGDVVMSLPALRATRERFSHAQLTVAVGKPGNEVVEMSGHADEVIAVDRVGLRDGFKPLSVMRIVRLVKDVRRRQFDFVIDLHSFSETNLLGFLSGAPKRLFSRRPGRSIDLLANFSPSPPVELNNQIRHLVDRYLDVLRPLGVEGICRVPKLMTRSNDDRTVDAMLRKAKGYTSAPLVGLFPGAGHPGRCWPLERFVELADSLSRNDGVRTIVFAGPEERSLVPRMHELFPSALILDRLTISQLASALARLSVFVTNETGPMHIATAVGTAVVVLLDCPTPNSFVPLADQHRIIFSDSVVKITTEEVYSATRELLVGSRTTRLFSS